MPILPGFEEELTTFIDKGKVGKLPNGHRFGEVVAAVRAANKAFMTEVADDNHEGGGDDTGTKELIGTWTEFTPTGALDIDVVTMAVQDL
ncbi:MAG: hypothetical protein E6J90_22280 [Deltaproteobacteria bacterium]|nr:MAG: hypothetical protein E6J91_37640 [Deltaproteobacteria bacterium]TMQ17490.1 MAG: hypothetical protein E6J90_22280 [Deltaproteobacteria bacterium]